MNLSKTEQAYERAKQVIRICSTKHGLFASGGKKGYDAVWARDSMISLIGACSDSESKEEFKEVFKQSLVLLEKNQSKLGQIPNSVDKFSNRKSHVDFQSIDSSLWFIIGEYFYKKNYDNSLFNKHESSIKKAILWLKYQDMSERGMPGQLPTTDWQDAFPHKYGHTINTQALYYYVLNLIGEKEKAHKLKLIVNENEEWGLWNKEFYFPYRWKNHGKYKEAGNWFDSLGNLLAIVFDLSDKSRTNKILNYIRIKKINLPYPVRAIYPSIKKSSKHWQDYFNDCDARNPHHYLNGGVWSFIGGFYVISLIKLGKFNEAEIELEKLAEANLRGDFPEWINPKTRKTYGELQAWSAGMYIAAYCSLKNTKNIFKW